MEFHVLGPVGVYENGRAIDIGVKKIRGVLGILLMAPNEAVPIETLARRLWSEDEAFAGLSPAQRSTLQVYVSRLRAGLKHAGARAEVSHEHGTYRLIVDRSTIDYHRFRDLVSAGRASTRSADHARAAELFAEALKLWHGPPIPDLTSPWAERVREGMRLNELVPTQYHLIDAELALGAIESARVRLQAMQPDHETEDDFAHRWMHVAVADGPDTLHTYFRGFTRRVRDKLGIEPSDYLVGTYRTLAKATTAASTAARNERRGPVRQVTRPSPYFTGRHDVLADLDSKLLDRDGGIVAISGPPAVGKSELARFGATTRRHHFPDGDLVHDLNGYGPGRPETTESVVTSLLDALGVADRHVSADPTESLAMLRHSLDGRRMLVVLDNARDSTHVRPMLTAMPTCSVIVTSQQQLTALAQRDGARRIALRTLTDDESVELLTKRMADARVTIEPDSVRDLASLLGGLPLGLHVAADLVSAIPDAPIRDIVTDLRMRRRALLDAGSFGDEATTTLRTVFKYAYDVRSPDAARLYRLVGLLPVTQVTTAAAAALAGLSVDEAETTLDTLVGAHLLDKEGTDRYRQHDLLHLFSVDLAATEPESGRATALHRLFDWYLGTTANAVAAVSPHAARTPPLALTSGVTPREFHDGTEALRWCVAERPAVLAIARLAAEHGYHEHVWRQIGTFNEILNRHGEPRETVDIQHVAIRSAELTGSLEARAGSVNELGLHLYNMARFDEAETYFRRTYDLVATAEAAGPISSDLRILATVSLHNVATISKKRGQHQQAIVLLERCLLLADAVDYPLAQAHVRYSLGDCYRLIGRSEPAARYLEDALRRCEYLDDPRGRGEALSALGLLRLAEQDAMAAIGYCGQALDFCREAMDERLVAETLVGLAEACSAAKRHEDALRHASEAVSLSRIVSLPNLARALEIRGHAHVATGHPSDAVSDWRECAVVLRELRNPRASTVAALADATEEARMPSQLPLQMPMETRRD